MDTHGVTITFSLEFTFRPWILPISIPLGFSSLNGRSVCFLIITLISELQIRRSGLSGRNCPSRLKTACIARNRALTKWVECFLNVFMKEMAHAPSAAWPRTLAKYNGHHGIYTPCLNPPTSSSPVSTFQVCCTRWHCKTEIWQVQVME